MTTTVNNSVFDGTIFEEEDRSVKVTRNRINLEESRWLHKAYDGLVYHVNCFYCDSQYKLGLRWHEVEALLKGEVVPSVGVVDDGWELSFNCLLGCDHVTRFQVTREELEKEMKIQSSKRRTKTKKFVDEAKEELAKTALIAIDNAHNYVDSLANLIKGRLWAFLGENVDEDE